MKNFYWRNGLLITLLITSVAFLFAQVNQKSDSYLDQKVEGVQSVDSIPDVDNREGLEELDKIIKRYEEGNLYLSGEVIFYENADSSSGPQDRTAFTTIITPTASSYEIDSVQTIASETLTILIDKQEKSIAVIEREKEVQPQQEKANEDIAAQLREFKEYIHSIVVSKNGSDKKLSIQFKDDVPSNASSYEIIYEAETYRIKKVRMELIDGEITDSSEDQKEEDELVYVDDKNNEIETGYYAKVKISAYEWIYKAERKVDPDVLQLDRFITKVNDEYVPVGSFKDYEILN